MSCTHHHIGGDRGTLGCPEARQGYDDSEKGSPKKEAASECYNTGYNLHQHDIKAGQELAELLGWNDKTDQ
jgi:hypothetical protein